MADQIATDQNRYRSHVDLPPPKKVHGSSAAASGNYRATTYLGRLHVVLSKVDFEIEGGDGGTVTATAGLPIKAGVPWFFRPDVGRDTLGYATQSGSNFAADDLVISVVELYPPSF